MVVQLRRQQFAIYYRLLKSNVERHGLESLLKVSKDLGGKGPCTYHTSMSRWKLAGDQFIPCGDRQYENCPTPGTLNAVASCGSITCC